jgi:MoxR-like ATPase
MATLNARHGSPSTAPVILLMGQPGIGKTTAIRQIVNALGNRAGGLEPEDLIEGVQWSNIDLLLHCTLEADRVVTF